MEELPEPAVFRGSIGNGQFSLDGQRLLFLSGGMWNVFDSMRLIDVTPSCIERRSQCQVFEEKPVPPWLVGHRSSGECVYS